MLLSDYPGIPIQQSALLKVVGDIERASGNGMTCAQFCFALDISAAFDAVNHLILCRRTESDFGVAVRALS